MTPNATIAIPIPEPGFYWAEMLDNSRPDVEPAYKWVVVQIRQHECVSSLTVIDFFGGGRARFDFFADGRFIRQIRKIEPPDHA